MIDQIAQNLGDYSAEVTTSNAVDSAAAAAAGTAALGIGIGLLIFWFVVGILGFIIWIWALIDAIRRQFTNQNDKVLWLVLIIVLGLLGAIVYLIAGRSKGTIPGGQVASAQQK